METTFELGTWRKIWRSSFKSISVTIREQQRRINRQHSGMRTTRNKCKCTAPASDDVVLLSTMTNVALFIRMADGCWEKAGELVAIAGDYYKAIEIYETLIQNQVSGRSTRIKISGQMLIAGLCHFASNVSTVIQPFCFCFNNSNGSNPMTGLCCCFPSP